MKGLMCFLYYEQILHTCSKCMTVSENKKPEADGFYYLSPYSLLLPKTDWQTNQSKNLCTKFFWPSCIWKEIRRNNLQFVARSSSIYRPSEGCNTMKHRIRGEKELWLKGRKANEYTCRKREREKERKNIVYLSVSMSCSLSCQSKWSRAESFLKSWEQDKLHFRSAVSWLMFLLHVRGYYIVVSSSAGLSAERKQH